MIPASVCWGLARRAGKLAFGDELVRQLCADHKARCVLVAADAGESTAKKAALYAARVSVPCITLPHGKDELGAAIGKNGCAVCALSDIGMAAAAIGKLAAVHEEYADIAAQLSEKNARIQSRRGKKKAPEPGNPASGGGKAFRSRKERAASRMANAQHRIGRMKTGARLRAVRRSAEAAPSRSINRAKINAQSAY